MKTKTPFSARRWHTWISIFLLLPIVIVSLTAVLLAHKKTLGLDGKVVDRKWFPGYRMMESGRQIMDIRATLMTQTGGAWVGTPEGLYLLNEQSLVAVDVFRDTPIRALAETGFGLVVAARNGVWVGVAGHWNRVLKGDAWVASTRSDGSVVVAIKDQGTLVSYDGASWKEDVQLSPAQLRWVEMVADKPVVLSKLIKDLHTGQAFLGKTAEWLWIDLVGLSLLILAVTGLRMWWRANKRFVIRRGDEKGARSEATVRASSSRG